MRRNSAAVRLQKGHPSSSTCTVYTREDVRTCVDNLSSWCEQERSGSATSRTREVPSSRRNTDKLRYCATQDLSTDLPPASLFYQGGAGQRDLYPTRVLDLHARAMGSGCPTLVAGSYERFLFGFSHPASFNNKQSFELKTQFTVRVVVVVVVDRYRYRSASRRSVNPGERVAALTVRSTKTRSALTTNQLTNKPTDPTVPGTQVGG